MSIGCQSSGLPVVGMSGTTTTPSISSRVASEKLSSGIQMKWPKGSPSANAACMSASREAVPSRSSALVMSP